MKDCQQLSAQIREFLTVMDQSVTVRRHYSPKEHEDDIEGSQGGRRPDGGSKVHKPTPAEGLASTKAGSRQGSPKGSATGGLGLPGFGRKWGPDSAYPLPELAPGQNPQHHNPTAWSGMGRLWPDPNGGGRRN